MAGKLDATVADPGDALPERYADLGRTPKARIPCLQWNRHVPWSRTTRGLERQPNALVEDRHGGVGSHAWLNRQLVRRCSRRSLYTEIAASGCNRRPYLGFLIIGDATTTRGRCRVPS